MHSNNKCILVFPAVNSEFLSVRENAFAFKTKKENQPVLLSIKTLLRLVSSSVANPNKTLANVFRIGERCITCRITAGNVKIAEARMLVYPNVAG